jgi:hypothetical protein
MSENQKKILQMLAEGKISVEEATRLLYLIGESAGEGPKDSASTGRVTPKYLYIRVEPKGQDSGSDHGKVNIRVPVGFIRAGMKLKSFIPSHVADDVNKAFKAQGIGFDIRDLKDEYIEGLLTALSENEINVDSTDAEVRIRAE